MQAGIFIFIFIFLFDQCKQKFESCNNVLNVFYLGGRFKKEVVLDGQSYLLLIRDEGGLPEVQVKIWLAFILYIKAISLFFKSLS